MFLTINGTDHGALGCHPSLLPRHRGRDALRWAIHMRESVTGGSVYWSTDQADTGLIAAQEWCHIRPDDNQTSLWQRELGPMGVRLFECVLKDLSNGHKVAVRHDEAVGTIICPAAA